MNTRQIKFRVWDATHKKMHYKVLIGNTFDKENYTAHSVYIMPNDVDYEVPESGQWMNFDENSDMHIMQFTGLIDKNGKEIYEGDIRFAKYFCGEDEVISYNTMEWSNGSEGAGFFWEGEEIPHWADRGVIGNIYENPELLTA